MLKKLTLLTIAVGAFVLVVMPLGVKAANTVTLTGTDGLTDITDSIDRGDDGDKGDAEEAFFVLCDGVDIENCESISNGTEYELTFSVTGGDAEEGPVMVFLMGSDMEYENPWTYSYDSDSTTGTLTVPLIKKAFYDEDGEKIPAFGISVIFAVEEGEDGPPSQMSGSYLATTVMQHEMIPPSPGNPAFGFTLTGAVGTSGFVHFYIPPALIDLLSYYEGIDLEPADMAIFMDDDQVSGTITETDDGGALIEIDVVFAADNNIISGIYSGGVQTVTKTVVAKQKRKISLTAKKGTLKKNKKAKLFGWLRNGKKNKKVRIYKKKKGTKKYTLYKKLTTKKNGYFFHRFAVKKKGTFLYKAKFTKNNGKVLSTTKERIKVIK